MSDLIEAAIVAAILYAAVTAVLDTEYSRFESECRESIERGVVYYECRDYWDLCAFYYNDCSSGERYEWLCDGDVCRAARVP